MIFFLLQAALLPVINTFLKNVFITITVTVHCGIYHLSPLSPFFCFLTETSISSPCFVLFCTPVSLLPFLFLSCSPPRPDLSPNCFSSFSFHLHSSLDHFISLPVFPAALSHLTTPLAASCHFYFCLLDFWGQNVKFTQDSLALSLLYFYFFAPLSGPLPIFGRRRMESSPNWPKLKVLTCASRCSTNQIMVSTSAKLTMASGTARGSTHSWYKVKNTWGGGWPE